MAAKFDQGIAGFVDPDLGEVVGIIDFVLHDKLHDHAAYFYDLTHRSQLGALAPNLSFLEIFVSYKI